MGRTARPAASDVHGQCGLQLSASRAQSCASCDAAIAKLQCPGVQNSALHRRLAWGWSVLADNMPSRHAQETPSRQRRLAGRRLSHGLMHSVITWRWSASWQRPPLTLAPSPLHVRVPFVHVRLLKSARICCISVRIWWQWIRRWRLLAMACQQPAAAVSCVCLLPARGQGSSASVGVLSD